MDPRRFDDLLRLWQDGEGSPAELQELGEALRDHPELRKELVRSVLVEVNLYGRFAKSAGTLATQPKPRSRVLELVAAALVLAISGFLLTRLFLMPKPTPMVEVPQAPKPSDATPAGRKAPPPQPPSPVAEKYVKLLELSTLSLSRAVERALENREGVAVRADLEEENGVVAYSVVLATGKTSKEIEIDASSGELLEAQNEDKDESAIAAALKIPLREAIEKALAAVPGRAVEADVEREDGRIRIEVKIVAEGRLREVLIDAETGDVVRQ